MKRKVLLTGATGNFGSRLAPRLATNAAVALRVIVRSPEKVADLKALGVEVIQGSFEDEASLRHAVDGIDTVVLITPFSPNAVDQAHAVIVAAQEARVRRIIRLSVIKADPNGPTDSHRLHGRTDAEIQESDLIYIILRFNASMYTLFGSSLETILNNNTITTTLGNSRIGMIDDRDYVDVFERVVVSSDYDNQIVTLTGPDSISLTEATNIFSQVLGRDITYIPVPDEETEQWWRERGVSGWYLDTLCEYSVAFRQNHHDIVTDSVERITGHPARSLDDFIREVFAPSVHR